VWGNVVIVEYEDKISALYAHLRDVYIQQGQLLKSGQIIGTIGKGDKNIFAAHLHFEIRDNVELGIGPGYSTYRPPGWIEPSAFIKSHRPKPPVVASTLTGDVKNGQVYLNWTQSLSENFSKYEIYRSETEGGTKDSTKRTLLAEGEEKNVTEFIDTKPLVTEETYFYAVATFETDGRSAISNEVPITIPRQIINLTNSENNQTFPRIQGKYIVWEDGAKEQTSFPQKTTLYYYNTETKELGSTKIGNLLERLEGPYSPSVYENYVCFSAKKSYYAKHDIYCHDMIQGFDLPISNDPYNHDTIPNISSNGYVVWTKQVGNYKKIYSLNLNDAVGPYLAVDAAYNQFSPALFGSRIVWKDTRVGNRTDLYTKDLADGEETLLATNVTTASFDISEKYIAWAQNGEIFLYDLGTREQRLIISADNVGDIKADQDNILYFDYDDGEYGHLYVFNIGSGKKTKIDMLLYWIPRIDIFESMVVFTAPGPNGLIETYMDIFLTYL
jgi:hypothetical protein